MPRPPCSGDVVAAYSEGATEDVPRYVLLVKCGW